MKSGEDQIINTPFGGAAIWGTEEKIKKDVISETMGSLDEKTVEEKVINRLPRKTGGSTTIRKGSIGPGLNVENTGLNFKKCLGVD